MKKELGAVNCLYPMPVILAGALVDGKPNYITIANVGIVGMNDVSLNMGTAHYTNAGIRENGTFSVNLPSAGMVKETDYCGLVSGRKADKGAMFETFYGVLETAPMIAGCPVNMECRLVRTIDMPGHDVFIGEVVASYCDEDVSAGNGIDLSKFEPILYATCGKGYFRLGARFADARSVGRELM